MAGRKYLVSRSRPRPRARNNVRGIRRMVQHLASGTSVRTRLPADPPSMTFGLQFERLVEYGIYISTSVASSVVTAPTTQETGTVIWGQDKSKTGEQSFTVADISAAVSGAFGITGGIWALKAVSLWGPDEPGINNRVEGTFLNSSTLGLTMSDDGTRTNRARIRMAVPQLEWIPSSTTVSTEVFRVQIGVANNFYAPPTPSKLGTLRMCIAYKSAP